MVRRASMTTGARGFSGFISCTMISSHRSGLRWFSWLQGSRITDRISSLWILSTLLFSLKTTNFRSNSECKLNERFISIFLQFSFKNIWILSQTRESVYLDANIWNAFHTFTTFTIFTIIYIQCIRIRGKPNHKFHKSYFVQLHVRSNY